MKAGTQGQQHGAPVEIERLTKRYDRVPVLDDVSLSISAGEFVALLGPSGSGKTTILMVLSGFVQQDEGRVLVGGHSIDRLPAHERGIGIVFQNYALFPHLTVAENLAYPLRRRGLDNDEIRRRVGEALELVRLDNMGGRGISQLSGGQQQRVAIARAVIFRPTVLLLDEPMSALDRKLREAMQLELRSLQREIGATTVLVTHDQEEAMSMADRIAIMNGGRMIQVGSPSELYNRPADTFVADFVGRTNFFPVQMCPAPQIVGFSAPLGKALAEPVTSTGDDVVAGVRPEGLLIDAVDPEAPAEPARVLQAAFAGARQTLLIEAHGYQVIAETQVGGPIRSAGDAVRLSLRPGSVRLFDRPADFKTQQTTGKQST